MKNQLEIYPYNKKRYSEELKKLKEWNTSPTNKELIIQFQNHLFSKNCSDMRVAKLSSQLRRIALVLEKDFNLVKKEDIEKSIAYYNRQNSLSEETKNDYRRCIKQFYLWFKDKDERLETENKDILKETNKLYKYIEKEIKTTCKINSLDYSNILKDEDIDLVVEKGCKTHKEKAFIKFLFETGVRAGELLNMKIKDIEFKDNHALAKVDGKTGERRVFIIHSLPYLTKYLDIHPYKDNLNSYLWLGDSPQRLYQPIYHKGGQKLLDRCFDRAGLKIKKHNYHWFRHSRATLLAPTFTEVILCKYMGWEQGSKQVKRYVHLCAKQVETAFMEMNGLIKKEDNKNLPIKCSCTAINDNKSRYCFRCGKPLSVEIAIKDEENYDKQIKDTLKDLMEMMKNPEMLKKFEEFNKKN